jgi:osmoprotectant transport system permease protein
MNDFVNAFKFMGNHTSLLFDKTVEHLHLSGVAVGIALLMAVPVGLWLGHLHRGSVVAINVANIGRALPSLALISIGAGILGIGFTNVVVALVVLAAPPMLTNAYVAVDQVEPDAVEAARGMGMRASQVFWRVELPLSLPLLFAGIRTATLFVVASATLAAIAGGGGLGDIIVNQASYGLPGVLAAAIWVSALAVLADFTFGLLQRLVTPRGLRKRRTEFESAPPGSDPRMPAATARPMAEPELR